MKKTYTLTVAVLLTALFFTACDRKAAPEAKKVLSDAGSEIPDADLDKYLFRIVANDSSRAFVAYKTGSVVNVSEKKTPAEFGRFETKELKLVNIGGKSQMQSDDTDVISDPDTPLDILTTSRRPMCSTCRIFTNGNGELVYKDSAAQETILFPVSRLIYVDQTDGGILFGWVKQDDIPFTD